MQHACMQRSAASDASEQLHMQICFSDLVGELGADQDRNYFIKCVFLGNLLIIKNVLSMKLHLLEDIAFMLWEREGEKPVFLEAEGIRNSKGPNYEIGKYFRIMRCMICKCSLVANSITAEK